jgi:hypothetical protein
MITFALTGDNGQGQQLFVFLAENETEANKYAAELMEGKPFVLTAVSGVQIQHEILFELSKEYKRLVMDEASKHSLIKPSNP